MAISYSEIEEKATIPPHQEVCRRRAVTASDAAYESGRGSAGFLSVIDPRQPEETRLARAISLPPSLCEIWGVRVTYIAQLELLTVLVALTEVAGSGPRNKLDLVC